MKSRELKTWQQAFTSSICFVTHCRATQCYTMYSICRTVLIILNSGTKFEYESSFQIMFLPIRRFLTTYMFTKNKVSCESYCQSAWQLLGTSFCNAYSMNTCLDSVLLLDPPNKGPNLSWLDHEQGDLLSLQWLRAS